MAVKSLVINRMIDPVENLRQLFDAAVASCQPSLVLPPALPPKPSGRIVVVGAGKASAAMAAAVESVWGPKLSGVVVTRYGHGVPTRYIEVIEAGHPLPDEAGLRAAERALAYVRGLAKDDFVLVLLSGGGSALWSAPQAPLTLEQKQQMTRELVLSGAAIAEINCVRRHLSAIKGGRLAAAAHPARVLTLAISDVVGDDPVVIASGPTVGDPTVPQDAIEILRRYGVSIPAEALAILQHSDHSVVPPSDPRLARSSYRIIARGSDALAAAADLAHKRGCDTKLIGVDFGGDTQDAARIHAELALHSQARERPLILLSGGELTVKVQGNGSGGPNRQYLLQLALCINGMEGVYALAADTDGIDGNDHATGAWIAPDTLEKARQQGLDAAEFVRRNNSGAFFSALGQEIVTGPTRTNVNDFRAIWITPRN